MAEATHTYQSNAEFLTHIDRSLLQFDPPETDELARVVESLVRAFAPDRVYIFGSRARGAAGPDSDVDLLVVVADAGPYPHRLAQEAYRSLGAHTLPFDIVFMARDEFQWRASVASSLPATVLREGHLLYAAA
ncbi:MAG: hypothetical protein AVDCRST_MAG77-3011 [uncultured Chloroflexi bacterium]|uniref:Polymerase nucleotidyl transferase domain-containing protein n=1 Tax=uncultured Chloroflexota bacterium TaxID=166587 RepID=A0A6J4IC32_9CHLR|nr:MAG: hypothetical protein AVDCRST_MAG77-3011 [uncultured Chloroflexota bacterium]